MSGPLACVLIRLCRCLPYPSRFCRCTTFYRLLGGSNSSHPSLRPGQSVWCCVSAGSVGRTNKTSSTHFIRTYYPAEGAEEGEPIIDDCSSSRNKMLHRPLPTSTSTSRPPALQPARPPSGPLAPNHNHSHGSSSSSTVTNRPPVMKLQFINTAHPRESTSAKRISQIRSHVARDSHARRRQRKAANGNNSSNACACACPAASSAASHAPAAASAEPPARSESPDSTSAGTSSVGARSRLPTSSSSPAAITCTSGSTTSAEDEGLLGRPGFRRIAPKTRPVERSAELPHPTKLIGDTKTDGWSFAWELSPDECKAFDFCKSALLLLLCSLPCSLSPHADLRSSTLPIYGACGAHLMLPNMLSLTRTPLVAVQL